MSATARKKGRLQAWGEYALVWTVLQMAKALPAPILRGGAVLAADAAYRVLGRRRRVAEDNVRAALGAELGEAGVRDVARRSFRAFAHTVPELVKMHRFLTAPDARRWMEEGDPILRTLFERARALHDLHRGCVFVTPHLGNWELLPFVSAAVGIPMVVVARPLDNPHLERLVYASRAGAGQLFIPKRNSLLPLQQMLARGKSVGLLPDQSTMNGLAVPFFGRPAWTTPVPAVLALRGERPLVVVGCVRRDDGWFTGHVADPIHPRLGGNERDELVRLTTAMNAEMEQVIRRFPDQYFWMHNRWKTYGRDMGGTAAR
jgi:KDO2-lipid IV(A) lauroyltransferase